MLFWPDRSCNIGTSPHSAHKLQLAASKACNGSATSDPANPQAPVALYANLPAYHSHSCPRLLCFFTTHAAALTAFHQTSSYSCGCQSRLGLQARGRVGGEGVAQSRCSLCEPNWRQDQKRVCSAIQANMDSANKEVAHKDNRQLAPASSGQLSCKAPSATVSFDMAQRM